MKFASMPVCHSFSELEPYLTVVECGHLRELKDQITALQRAHAYYLIKKMVGGRPERTTIRYQCCGKPYIEGITADISISHKPDFVYVGVADRPFKTGVDVEDLTQEINTGCFIKHALHRSELHLLEKISQEKRLSLASSIIILWSIKESFYKCCNYPLVPKDIRICGISDSSEVEIAHFSEVRRHLAAQQLRVRKISFGCSENHVFSKTIMSREEDI